MKLVTFARAMAPHGIGDTRLVTDVLAAQLQTEGFLSASEAWPAGSDAPAARPPKRPVVGLARPTERHDRRSVR